MLYILVYSRPSANWPLFRHFRWRRRNLLLHIFFSRLPHFLLDILLRLFSPTFLHWERKNPKEIGAYRPLVLALGYSSPGTTRASTFRNFPGLSLRGYSYQWATRTGGPIYNSKIWLDSTKANEIANSMGHGGGGRGRGGRISDSSLSASYNWNWRWKKTRCRRIGGLFSNK